MRAGGENSFTFQEKVILRNGETLYDRWVPPTLELDRPRPGVAVVRLNRPERLNAINEVMQRELLDTLSELACDSTIHAVVLTGAGRGFCAGIDVRDFGPNVPDATAPAVERMRFQERMAALAEAIRALPQPVIAAVNGPCVGAGFALCLAADIRICSSEASFGNAAILLGLSGAEMGMSYHLPRIVGTSVAADWMLTGRTVSATEADRRGLVSELVEPDRLAGRAVELASLVADLAPLGVQLTKRALQVNTDAASLSSALELENRNQVITHATEEAAERRQKWSR
jgi:enoyl-CoA hydratase/carnithine racemase